MVDAAIIKQHAQGRWPELLSRLAGVDSALLDGKHHPCPRCGGKDRFRAFNDFTTTGGVICNQCFDKKNSDGFSTLAWLLDTDFAGVAKTLVDELNLAEQPEPASMLDAICQAKHIPRDELIGFGASELRDMRGPIVRLPMYGPDGLRCSHFDLSTASEALRKGLCAKGQPAGLFWSERPSDGLVLVTEGVKDAAALESLGFHAIGVCGKSLGEKFAPLFAKCDVVLVPDLDDGGSEGAAKSAKALAEHASSVRVATLPGERKSSGGDGVREALANHGEQAVRQAIAASVDPTAVAVKRPVTLAEASREYLRQIESGEELLSTGFDELDYALGGGVARGEMVVLAARPSHGKTAFALQLLHNAAALGLVGLLVSQEMSAPALGKRHLQYLTETAELFWRDKLAELSAEVQADEHKSAPIYVVEACQSVEHVCEEIKQAVELHGVQVVAVDYLQLLKSKGHGRYEQVTNASVALRECATETGVLMLTLCQLSRAIESRDTKMVKLSDIKESGQIEQDADVALGLMWPQRNNPLHQPADEYWVTVLKNRNREIREPAVKFQFAASSQRFSAKTEDYTWQPEDYEQPA